MKHTVAAKDEGVGCYNICHRAARLVRRVRDSKNSTFLQVGTTHKFPDAVIETFITDDEKKDFHRSQMSAASTLFTVLLCSKYHNPITALFNRAEL